MVDVGVQATYGASESVISARILLSVLFAYIARVLLRLRGLGWKSKEFECLYFIHQYLQCSMISAARRQHKRAKPAPFVSLTLVINCCKRIGADIMVGSWSVWTSLSCFELQLVT